MSVDAAPPFDVDQALASIQELATQRPPEALDDVRNRADDLRQLITG